MTIADSSKIARPKPGLETLPVGTDRVITLLDDLVRRPQEDPRGVRELAADIGSTKSTVARLLQDMSNSGLAQRDSQGRYRVGARMQVVSSRVHLSCSLFRDGGIIAQELADAAGATATINVVATNNVSGFVAVQRSSVGPIGYNLTPGTVLPLHAGATGRALLSAMSGDIPSGLELDRFTEDTITDRATLQGCVERDRRNGYVLSIGQHFVQAAGLSAPFIFGGLPAAVTITRPRTETTEHDLGELIPLVRGAADRLGRLGDPPLAMNSTPHPGHSTDVSDGGTAVDRLLRLIIALARHPGGLPTGGRALGRVIRANPSTATKLQITALHSGLATKTADTLMVGPTLMRWSASLGMAAAAAELVRPAVEALSEETGETVGLIELDHQSCTARQTLVVQGSQQMHYWMATDTDIPLHAGASGKAILAHLDSQVLTQLPLVRYTANTDVDPASIERELATIRTRGWAVGDGERIPDAYGIAAPIFTDGQITGSITVTIPRLRLDYVDVPEISAAVVRTADQVSRILSLM
ncbi:MULTISPECIES: IclR family transcriptional regulator [unclassified Rhodococcus (in: high G+C Gram-positive bacteria)]|uniref:IclR family transcriptional regulator n=1 Tax=unclassified Rhodococcus (in: high G+C Gram-positive bacteria) TaxID=192944 RepID=UPI0011EDFA4B|nr:MULTISPECIES: IclR family transcriptional regulator C-terminal domain-containing protein [unclassified Rhodococcus (in: high G+C Gram-positive bacteria)]KAA0923964.1 helix-turn-helix domain-containing protein [Rhodococcus sp. ANT_H53B]MDV7991713.1 IclR family transcriptional regulator C-terminal domain-containing protein [Rhodococcus sp. IEGM 1374]